LVENGSGKNFRPENGSGKNFRRTEIRKKISDVWTLPREKIDTHTKKFFLVENGSGKKFRTENGSGNHFRWERKKFFQKKEKDISSEW